MSTLHIANTKPLRETCLSAGVCAKIMFLCRRPRVTQPEFVGALLGCFDHYSKYEPDYANKFLKCTKNVPKAVTDATKDVNNEKRNNILMRFESNVKPLLIENKVESIIMALCEIIDNDIDIKGATIISEIDGISKSDLPSITHFYFSEFVVGVLIYAIQNTINCDGALCATNITDEHMEQYSNTPSNFSWSWNLQTGELGAIIAYAKKSQALNGLLDFLKRNHDIDFFCVFGGVASKLIDDDTCELFSVWMTKNEKARLYLCYETGEAAKGRARLLNPDKIKADGLPLEPNQRMIVKEKNVQEAINKFMPNVRNRVGLVPIVVPLNHHVLLMGTDVYWNNLTENRSSENTTYKAENTPTGIKTKREQLEYITRILAENNDSSSQLLIEILQNKTVTL